MPKAFEGQHVSDRHGRQGKIIDIIGHIAKVVWFDGDVSQVPTDTLHATRRSGCWFSSLAVALSAGATITAGAWRLWSGYLL